MMHAKLPFLASGAQLNDVAALVRDHGGADPEAPTIGTPVCLWAMSMRFVSRTKERRYGRT
jgi:hypothetical protein